MSNGSSYRRASVFSALLLITVGGLFLYANLHPEFSSWPIVATYWPVVIIFWGVGKLVDYLLLRGTPEAAVVSRLSAGDIIGLIFLLLLGSFISQAYRHGWLKGGPIAIGEEEIGCLLGNQYEFSDELELPVATPRPLTLTNERGGVAVTGGEANRIRLRAHKRVCASSEAEAREVARRMVPVLEPGEEGYDFHWDSPRGATGLLRADLTLELPRALGVKLSTRRGDVAVSGLQAAVEVSLSRGEARIDNIEGGVSVEIRRGSVRVENVRGGVNVSGRGDEVSIRRVTGTVNLAGEYYGPIQFAAITGAARFVSRRTTFSAANLEGEMTMDSGELTLRGASGEITLLTRDKEIQVEGVPGPLRIANRNGSVVVRLAKPPASPIEVENERGGIHLYLPAASSFQLSATARKGDIETDFAGLTSERERGPDEVLTGSVGDARTPIRLSTSYGTIGIHRVG